MSHPKTTVAGALAHDGARAFRAFRVYGVGPWRRLIWLPPLQSFSGLSGRSVRAWHPVCRHPLTRKAPEAGKGARRRGPSAPPRRPAPRVMSGPCTARLHGRANYGGGCGTAGRRLQGARPPLWGLGQGWRCADLRRVCGGWGRGAARRSARPCLAVWPGRFGAATLTQPKVRRSNARL